MSNVIHLTPERVPQLIEQLERFTDNHGHEPPSGGGGGPTLETRVAKLETLAEKTGERLGAIERDVAVLRTQSAHYATKEDIAALRGDVYKIVNEQTWKIITWTTGIGTALIAATYLIARSLQ